MIETLRDLANLLDRKTYAILAVVVCLGIVFLELYPFTFRVPVAGVGAVRKLLDTSLKTPHPGDFLRNIMAYVVLSFCATMALGPSSARLGAVLGLVGVGVVMSISFEVAQYFIPGRFTDAMDVYADTLGVLIGSVAAASVVR